MGKMVLIKLYLDDNFDDYFIGRGTDKEKKILPPHIYHNDNIVEGITGLRWYEGYEDIKFVKDSEKSKDRLKDISRQAEANMRYLIKEYGIQTLKDMREKNQQYDNRDIPNGELYIDDDGNIQG